MTHPFIVTSIIAMLGIKTYYKVVHNCTWNSILQRRFTLSLVKDVHDEYILFWLHSGILLTRAHHSNVLLHIVCLHDCFITSLHIVQHNEKNTELAIGIFAPLLYIQSSYVTNNHHGAAVRPPHS